HRIDKTMAFMIESCWSFQPTAAALATAQPDYDGAWSSFPKAMVER
ncbi:MAG: homogentisate 1,2-dioxygenase, partial [Pseudomonadota bacterium]|nr:homogentisate 1,2-dioxygenase [Pseudomonadota bacterium]